MATQKGVLATVDVYAGFWFRYMSKSDKVYDARGDSACKSDTNHVVVLTKFEDGVATIMNSWGTSWGVKGLKKIIPCSEKGIIGSFSTLIYPYSF